MGDKCSGGHGFIAYFTRFKKTKIRLPQMEIICGSHALLSNQYVSSALFLIPKTSLKIPAKNFGLLTTTIFIKYLLTTAKANPRNYQNGGGRNHYEFKGNKAKEQKQGSYHHQNQRRAGTPPVRPSHSKHLPGISAYFIICLGRTFCYK